MDKMKIVESRHKKKNIAKFSVGDTVKVYVKIVEEGVQRTQAFEGIVIGRKGSGSRESFTVRRISYGEGVERTFLFQAPTTEKVEIIKRGGVRRAKLYYLRKKIGKKTAVEEKIGPDSGTEEPSAGAEEEPAAGGGEEPAAGGGEEPDAGAGEEG